MKITLLMGMGWKPQDLETAFETVQSNIVWTGIEGVVKVLAVFLVLSTIVASFREAMNKPSGMDAALVAQNILKGAFIIGLALSVNAIITGINSEFTLMEETMNQTIEESQDISTQLEQMVVENSRRWQQYRSDVVFSKVTDGNESEGGFLESTQDFLIALGHPLEAVSEAIDDLAYVIMKGLMEFCIIIAQFIWENVYLTFLCGRYVYLLMLELVSPVAVICIIHSSTLSYFMSWVKNMFTCHLLLPAYYLTNLFANELCRMVLPGMQEAIDNMAREGYTDQGMGSAATPDMFVGISVMLLGSVYLIACIFMFIIIKTRMLSTVTGKINNLF